MYVPGSWSQTLPTRFVTNRDLEIERLCAGRRVLHIGASDWPFTESKGARGLLLHQKLERVAAEVIGVDVSQEAVALLRNYTSSELIVCDATKDQLPGGARWDVVVCGDVIEHVEDLGGLVRGCRDALAADGILCLSTINCTSLKPALRAMFGREAVHHDHIAYFSYSTLCSLLDRSGLAEETSSYFSYPTKSGISGLFFGAAFAAFPATADGIIVCAKRRR